MAIEQQKLNLTINWIDGSETDDIPLIVTDELTWEEVVQDAITDHMPVVIAAEAEPQIKWTSLVLVILPVTEA